MQGKQRASRGSSSPKASVGFPGAGDADGEPNEADDAAGEGDAGDGGTGSSQAASSSHSHPSSGSVKGGTQSQPQQQQATGGASAAAGLVPPSQLALAELAGMETCLCLKVLVTSTDFSLQARTRRTRTSSPCGLPTTARCHPSPRSVVPVPVALQLPASGRRWWTWWHGDLMRRHVYCARFQRRNGIMGICPWYRQRCPSCPLETWLPMTPPQR